MWYKRESLNISDSKVTAIQRGSAVNQVLTLIRFYNGCWSSQRHPHTTRLGQSNTTLLRTRRRQHYTLSNETPLAFVRILKESETDLNWVHNIKKHTVGYVKYDEINLKKKKEKIKLDADRSNRSNRRAVQRGCWPVYVGGLNFGPFNNRLKINGGPKNRPNFGGRTLAVFLINSEPFLQNSNFFCPFKIKRLLNGPRSVRLNWNVIQNTAVRCILKLPLRTSSESLFYEIDTSITDELSISVKLTTD
ncbi:hypothetical protein BpHYR1_017457 [Brachionus plicatilis]|uniref:Uncharacterized protein n=1 Tax=Brachionus plicatilis TaxID=10195 RepID=A0A3M7SMS0_BRAPC|nr:hypothetical protein BpHYR1_017457 [Brachionus plicatilis]